MMVILKFCGVVWINLIKPIHLRVFYRPHDTDVSYMEKLLVYNSCERLQNDRYILTGDFNVPHIDWTEYCETG